MQPTPLSHRNWQVRFFKSLEDLVEEVSITVSKLCIHLCFALFVCEFCTSQWNEWRCRHILYILWYSFIQQHSCTLIWTSYHSSCIV